MGVVAHWTAWFLYVACNVAQAGSPSFQLRASAGIIAHSDLLLVQVSLPEVQLSHDPIPLWAKNVPGASANVSVHLACSNPIRTVHHPSLWRVAVRNSMASRVYVSVEDSAPPGSVAMASLLVGSRVLPLHMSQRSDSSDFSKMFLLVSNFPRSCAASSSIITVSVNGVSEQAGRIPALHLHLPVQLQHLFRQQYERMQQPEIKVQSQPVLLQEESSPFQPSPGLVSSGLFNPVGGCASEIGAFVTCVKRQSDVSRCHEEQRRYMRCQREGVSGVPAAAEAEVADPLQDARAARFAGGASTLGNAAGTVSHLGSLAVSQAAVAMGLDVAEVEALCSALGDGDCPVQTMTNVPLPVVPGNNVVSGQAMGPFGPDFSAVAGLVIGAIINGIVGPEIIEAVQKFMTKIMKVIPPVLRKALVDGIDPLASIPQMPEIPDPQSIIDQARAQVEAAKAIASANLERAKAAQQMARAQADEQLARASAFQRQAASLQASIKSQAAAEVQKLHAESAAAISAAKLRATAAIAGAAQKVTAARAAMLAALDASREALGASTISDALATGLSEVRSLLTGSAELSTDAIIKLMKEIPSLSAHFDATGLRNEATQLITATDALPVVAAQSELLVTAATNQSHQQEDSVVAASLELLRSVGARIEADGLKKLAPSGHLEVVEAADVRAAAEEWRSIQDDSVHMIARAREATQALKSARSAVLHAEHQEEVILQDSEEVRRAIIEQQQLEHSRRARTTPSHGSEHRFAHAANTAASKPAGRRGLLAVILHYELSHALTTALTISTTNSFADALIPQLHDTLAPELHDRLLASLPLSISDTVGRAVEAALSQSVPPLLERALPSAIVHACTLTLTDVITRATANAVVNTVGHHLLNPPEVQRCCDACRTTGMTRSCACCVAARIPDVRELSASQARTQSYSTFYSNSATTLWQQRANASGAP